MPPNRRWWFCFSLSSNWMVEKRHPKRTGLLCSQQDILIFYYLQEIKETSRERSAASVILWTHPSQQVQSTPKLTPRCFWWYCGTKRSDGPWKTRRLPFFKLELQHHSSWAVCIPLWTTPCALWALYCTHLMDYTPLFLPKFFSGFAAHCKHITFDLQHSQFPVA